MKEKETNRRSNLRVKNLILKELTEIVLLYPDKPLAQHLRVILRPNKEIYKWSDDYLLKKVENYKYELQNDQDDIFYNDLDN